MPVVVGPEIDAQHADRRMGVEEALAARGCEADAAQKVEAAGRDVLDAFIVVSVDVVDRPARVAADGP